MNNKILIIFTLSILASLLAITTSCKQEPYTTGKLLYEKYCQNCHQENGEALGILIPPIANSDFLTKYKSDLPCIIYYGLKGKVTVNGVTYNQEMPRNDQFNDIDIANIINYINNSFGNNNGYTPLKEVQKALNECKVGESGMIELTEGFSE